MTWDTPIYWFWVAEFRASGTAVYVVRYFADRERAEWWFREIVGRSPPTSENEWEKRGGLEVRLTHVPML